MLRDGGIQTVVAILDRMFPGDKLRGAPAISELSGVEAFARKLLKNEALTALVSSEVAQEVDINEHLMQMRRAFGRENVNEFVNEALNFYFSNAMVIEVLTKKPSPLFPNETVLDDIDWDLLEPVYLRSL